MSLSLYAFLSHTLTLCADKAVRLAGGTSTQTYLCVTPILCDRCVYFGQGRGRDATHSHRTTAAAAAVAAAGVVNGDAAAAAAAVAAVAAAAAGRVQIGGNSGRLYGRTFTDNRQPICGPRRTTTD